MVQVILFPFSESNMCILLGFTVKCSFSPTSKFRRSLETNVISDPSISRRTTCVSGPVGSITEAVADIPESVIIKFSDEYLFLFSGQQKHVWFHLMEGYRY